MTSQLWPLCQASIGQLFIEAKDFIKGHSRQPEKEADEYFDHE